MGLIITFFVHIATQQVFGQEPEPHKAQNDVLSAIPEGGLKIGDSIPEAVWNLPLQVVNHPEGKDTITLNDYRGKLIILDFWATWCGSCINTFPKLNELQSQFDKIQFLLINGEKKPDIMDKVKLISKKIDIRERKFLLPSTLHDSLLAKWFPHNIIPHYVWIKAGRVISITDSYEVTAQKIQLAIDEHKPGFIVKEDRINFDYSKPICQNPYSVSNPVRLGRSAFYGYVPGLVSGKTQVKDESYKKYYFRNRPAISLYQFAFNCSYNQILLDVKSGMKFPSSPGDLDISDSEMESYRKKYLYCYELELPLSSTEDDVYPKMLSDLNVFFSLKARREKRVVACYILTRIAPNARQNRTQGLTKGTKVNSIQQFVFLYNYYPSYIKNHMPIIVDETGYTDKIEMILPKTGMKDINSMKHALNSYGFDLVSGDRSLEMCVIAD